MRQIFPTEKLRRKRCNTVCKILSTTTVVFLLLETTFAFAQTEFEGSLNSVSITDSEGTNNPPTANFTYTQDGDTFLFDASDSSDSDGSINQYKWDFGGGVVSEGKTATYIDTNLTDLLVTLTVVDNNDGVTISQKNILVNAGGVIDDFSSDTSSNYTLFTGGLNIFDGTAHSSGAWTIALAINNTEMASSDHSIKADLYYDGGSATSGLLARVDISNASGYLIVFENGRIVLKTYSSGKATWLAHYDGKYGAGTYTISMDISGTLIQIYNNDQLVLEKNDSTFTNGTYAGFIISPYGKQDSVTIDNLIIK